MVISSGSKVVVSVLHEEGVVQNIGDGGSSAFSCLMAEGKKLFVNLAVLQWKLHNPLPDKITVGQDPEDGL